MWTLTISILNWEHRQLTASVPISLSFGFFSCKISPINLFLDAPIKIGKFHFLNTSKFFKISKLWKISFEKPIPGSIIIFLLEIFFSNANFIFPRQNSELYVTDSYNLSWENNYNNYHIYLLHQDSNSFISNTLSTYDNGDLVLDDMAVSYTHLTLPTIMPV